MASAFYSWTLLPLLRFARTFAWVSALIVVFAATILVLPMMIDWQSYKPRLVGLLGEATGRHVAIDGPIEVVLLPQPALRVRDIKVANPPGATSPFLVEARHVAARLSWRALLQGRIEVTRIAVYEPRITIEVSADGKPNWWLPLLDSVGQEGSPLVPLSVDRVEIWQGQIAHARGLVGQSINAKALDLVVRLEEGAKRVHIAGSAVTNGVPITLSLDVRTIPSDKPPLALSLTAPGGRLSFDGWAGQRTASDPLDGHMSITAGYLPEFLRSVSLLLGVSPVRLNEAVLGEVEASADVRLAEQHAALERFRFRAAGERVDGSLQVSWDNGVSLTGRLGAPALDADRWIERLHGRPFLLPPSDGDPAAEEEPALKLELAVEAATVRYRHDTVRDVAGAFRVEHGNFKLLELRAVLPGDFRIHRKAGSEGDQVHPGYDGVIEIDGRDLRQTMKWIGIDTSAVPADRLRTLQVTGKTRPGKGFVHLEEASFALDDQTGTIAADVALSIPTVIVGRLRMPHLDLDAYRLSRAELDRMIPSMPASPEGPGTEPPLFDLGIAIDEVRFRGEPAREVDARVLLRGNLLTLKHVGVGALLGAHIEIAGTVDQFGTSPRLDLTWRGVLPDADRMLDYAGLPRFIHGRIGAAQVAGKATGTPSDITLSDLSLGMLGTTIAASGKVSFGEMLRFDFPRWLLASPEIGAFVAVAAGTPRRMLGAFRASGSLRGDGHKASFRGNITADGTPLSGDISSTLDPRPHVAISLQAPAGLSLDRWLPAAPQSGAAHAAHTWARSPEPARSSVGLEGLRGFDGTLSLSTPSIQWGPYALRNVDLSARLQQGVLEIDRLAGTLEGATVSLGGSIDARGAAPALALGGSLRDIDVSRTIAFAHTANDFGSDDLAVALEGKLNIEDFQLQSAGDTFAAHMLSASGSGRTTAQLRSVVTRGSLSLATIATGVGSLFSTEMGFASAVIDNFVGKWIATRGQLQIAGSVLTLREHTFQGPGATAYVTSRIDLATGHLDTSIQLDNGTNGAIDYNMELSGPLQAPTLRALPNRGR